MSHLLNALAWSGGGFAMGFLTCWIGVRAAIAESKRTGGSTKVKSNRLEVARSAIGVLILLMLLLSGVRYYQSTSCQTEYNREIAQSLSDRSEAQGKEGLAQIDLLTASLGTDREAARKATEDYIEAIAELERVRAASPVPPPPNCGDFG